METDDPNSDESPCVAVDRVLLAAQLSDKLSAPDEPQVIDKNSPNSKKRKRAEQNSGDDSDSDVVIVEASAQVKSPREPCNLPAGSKIRALITSLEQEEAASAPAAPKLRVRTTSAAPISESRPDSFRLSNETPPVYGNGALGSVPTLSPPRPLFELPSSPLQAMPTTPPISLHSSWVFNPQIPPQIPTINLSRPLPVGAPSLAATPTPGFQFIPSSKRIKIFDTTPEIDLRSQNLIRTRQEFECNKPVYDKFATFYAASFNYLQSIDTTLGSLLHHMKRTTTQEPVSWSRMGDQKATTQLCASVVKFNSMIIQELQGKLLACNEFLHKQYFAAVWVDPKAKLTTEEIQMTYFTAADRLKVPMTSLFMIDLVKTLPLLSFVKGVEFGVAMDNMSRKFELFNLIGCMLNREQHLLSDIKSYAYLAQPDTQQLQQQQKPARYFATLMYTHTGDPNSPKVFIYVAPQAVPPEGAKEFWRNLDQFVFL